ncbi:MAG: hypothetical protein QM760_08600 [Nibricoccus sp.]
MPSDLLGNSGVGVGRRRVRREDYPAPGLWLAQDQIRSLDKILPVPTRIYAKLERWHHLSFLRANDVMSMLHSVRAQAFEPKRIDALIHLINEDLGYQLHRAVQQVKFALSGSESAAFHFSDGSIELNATVSGRRSNDGSRTNLRRFRPVSIRWWHRRVSIAKTSTACFSLADLRSFRRCVRFLRAGSAQTVFAPETNLRPFACGLALKAHSR